MTNNYEITFENQVTGNFTGSGLDTIDAVLTQEDDGSWAGGAFSTAKGTGTGAFMSRDPNCRSDWRGRQVLDVFGENRPGVLPGDLFPQTRGNLVLEFYPATPPQAFFGSTLCPGTLHPSSKFNYIPFNDEGIWNPDIGFAIVLPPMPAQGTKPWPTPFPFFYHVVTAPSSITIDSSWDIKVEYPEPPPP